MKWVEDIAYWTLILVLVIGATVLWWAGTHGAITP